MNRENLTTYLADQSDQCVKCGLCLPHCPTYRLRRNEAESPRGRIALIQGLAEGQLADSPRLRSHLASCLECRACESACPSLVAFGSIMDGARALGNYDAPRWRRLFRRSLLDALTSASGTGLAAWLAGAYRATGLARLAERAGISRRPALGAYHRLVVQLRRPFGTSATHPGHPVEGTEVELFTGCIARAAQPDTLAAAYRVLRRLGFRVHSAPTQTCCGAMHRHNGFPERADLLLTKSAERAGNRTLVGIASACIGELTTHPALAGSREICRFLADSDWPQDPRLRPLRERVAVHEPCSQRNHLRDPSAAYDLLRRIPGVETAALPDNAFCCGAAGTYLLQQPTASSALLAPKLEALASLGVKILVTTNTGCALHLAAGVREAGLDVAVLHPVELVDRQLDPAPSGNPGRG